jgi:hypothetical protein
MRNYGAPKCIYFILYSDNSPNLPFYITSRVHIIESQSGVPPLRSSLTSSIVYMSKPAGKYKTLQLFCTLCAKKMPLLTCCAMMMAISEWSKTFRLMNAD